MADNTTKIAIGLEVPAVQLPGGDVQTQINSKQVSGSYITALTGEVSASGPGSAAATVSNAAVIAKLITGFVSGAGAVSSSDSLLSAINKLDGNIAGKQASGNYITALTGDVTASGPGSSAASIAASVVTGKLITGFVSGAGTVAATDTILQAFNKLDGNVALKAPLASPTFTGTPAFPSGTYTVPGIRFSGDTDTGISNPTANTVSFVVGGLNDKFQVDTTNVQIQNHQLSFYMDDSSQVTWPLVNFTGGGTQAASSNYMTLTFAASTTASNTSRGIRSMYNPGSTGTGRTVGFMDVDMNGGGTDSNMYGIQLLHRGNTTKAQNPFTSTGSRGLHIYYSNPNTTTGTGARGAILSGENGSNVGVALQILGGLASVGSTPQQNGIVANVSANSGTGSSGTANTLFNAGFFRIGTDADAAFFNTTPTVNAGLIASNGNSTAASFIVQDNATAVFTVADGGALISTGQAQSADGSNSAPIYSFTNSTGMGMYREDANTLGFAIGGNAQFKIKAGSTAIQVTNGIAVNASITTNNSSADLGATGASNGFRFIYANEGVKLATVGSGLFIKEGSDATMGVATLSSGTITVSTNKVTANSRIFLTVQGGTLTNVGSTYISARTPSTSFVISSSNILDASDVAWMIVEPA